MTSHRSRVCHLVVDCDDLERGVAFWSAVLDATEEPLSESSRHIYRRLRLPGSEIRVLLQLTDDDKSSKERMRLDLETDDVEASSPSCSPAAGRGRRHRRPSETRSRGAGP